MSSHIPRQLQRDHQPNLEGSIRRRAFTTDKEFVKSNARFGGQEICSRSTQGIYDHGGGTSTGVNDNFSEESNGEICKDAYGKAEAANCYRQAIDSKVSDKAFEDADREYAYGTKAETYMALADIKSVKGASLCIKNSNAGERKVAVFQELDVFGQRSVVHRHVEKVVVIGQAFATENGYTQGSYAMSSSCQVIADAYEQIFVGALSGTGNEPDETRPRTTDDALIANDDGTNAQQELGDNQEEDENITLVRKLAFKAGELYTTISAEIKDANDMLITMKKSNSVVPAASVNRLKTALTNHVNVLLQGLLTREDALAELHGNLTEKSLELAQIKDELDSLHLENGVLKEDLQVAETEVSRLKQTPGELDDDLKDQLENLGLNSVQELIDKHILLQDRVKVIEKNFTAKVDMVSAPSRISLGDRCQKSQMPDAKLKDNGMSSSFINKNGVDVRANQVKLPMPDKFQGKTRADLDRFFALYEASTKSKGWDDEQRATFLGSYLPKMQLYHDSLRKRKATYQEMKQELLDSLGSEGAIANFCLRSQLDRVTKAPGKPYKKFFEEIELQVIEAFGGDTISREDELKKILLRITEEDANAIFNTVVITNVTSNYFRLKELVLAMEATQTLKKKNDKPEAKKNDFSRKAGNGHRQYDQGENRGSSNQDEDRDTHKPNSNGEQSGKMVQQSFEGRDRSYGYNRCYKCQKECHFTRDCPEQQGHAHYVRLDDMKHCVPAVSSIINVNVKDESLFGKPALLDVFLDDVKVRVLLDSGATASVIRDTVIGKLLNLKDKNGHNIVEVPRDLYAEKRLVGADGRPLKVVNCVEIPVTWGAIPKKPAKFFVVQGLHLDALIGTNVLQEDSRWIEAICFALRKQNNEVRHVGSLNTATPQSHHCSTMGTVLKACTNDESKDKKGYDSNVKAHTHKSLDGDTVVIGGRNAFHFARFIGAKHWSSTTLNKNSFHSKITSGFVKRLIYFPSGDIFFHREMKFDAARDLLLKSLKQLLKLDTVEVIVLPVFRHCKFKNLSEKLYSWYNKQADAHIIGQYEELINWMEAKSRDPSLLYINAQGIVTEDGMKRLCQHLNQIGYNFETRGSMKRNQNDARQQRSQSNSKTSVRGSTCSNLGCHSYVSSVCKSWFNSNVQHPESYAKTSWYSKSNAKEVNQYRDPHSRVLNKNQP